MKHKVCSKLWTDINVRIPTKQILNCCKRMQYTTPTIEEMNELGPDIFHRRRENLEDKALLIANNELNSACDYCKETWPNSIWNSWNKWKDRDWTREDLDKLIDVDHTNYIEIMLGTTCNMTCMYCSADTSSAWADLKKIPRNHGDELWKETILNNLYAYIEKMNMTPEVSGYGNTNLIFYNFLGGEPLLEWDIFDILEKIMTIHRRRNSTGHIISITTNLNIKPKLLERFLELVKSSPDFRWVISASVDAIGPYGENIRDGLKWNQFENNVIRLLNTNEIENVSFLPTISSLSIPKHAELLNWIFDLVENKTSDTKWDIGSNAVTDQIGMHPGILPEQYVSYVDDAIDLLTAKYPRNGHTEWLQNVRQMIGTRRNDNDLERARQWFAIHGRIKNKDYFELFPMLKDIL